MVEKAIQIWTFAPDMIDVVQSYVQYEQHFTTNYYGFRTAWLDAVATRRRARPALTPPAPSRPTASARLRPAVARACVGIAHVRRYVLLRTLSILPTLLGVSVAVFLLIRLIPGTIVDQMIGTEGTYSEEAMRALRAFFGLDQPIHVQYASVARPGPARGSGDELAHRLPRPPDDPEPAPGDGRADARRDAGRARHRRARWASCPRAGRTRRSTTSSGS